MPIDHCKIDCYKGSQLARDVLIESLGARVVVILPDGTKRDIVGVTTIGARSKSDAILEIALVLSNNEIKY